MLDSNTPNQAANRMERTAVTVAPILRVPGAFLMRLLHFSPWTLCIAGGIVSLLLALRMLAETGEEEDHQEGANGRDAMQADLRPLAVRYLRNPAGLSLLAIHSGALESWLRLGVSVVLALFTNNEQTT